ncbi:MAG: RNA-splicing ligase RtcB [Candidatus Omnitrophota bacterium]|nr:MAG: RNA-splicing ligase RtcB [Candidatus Omnitrophota bacterium]
MKMENIKKLEEYKYLIPKQDGMRVPGILYISEKLLSKAIADNAPLQVMNVAKLPGIVKYSLAMPDVHWGYGAPIGGVGAFDYESGVIVPGFVGYDINCLTGETKILHKYGYYLPIENFEGKWEELICFNKEKKSKEEAKIIRFIKRKNDGDIYFIKTEAGYEIKATEEHPFWTEKGKKEVKNLKIGDFVVVFPFKGVPYEEPPDETILDIEEFKKVASLFNKNSRGNSLSQIIKKLEENGLLPLKATSPVLPEILKIIGYIFGDGSISFLKDGNSFLTSFFGKKEDIEEIKKDLQKIGFSCVISERKRKHKIKTEYSVYEFETTTYTCQTSSRALALFLISLGVPYGKKISSDFCIPEWILRLPLWCKRLFLASYFGAEMSSPKFLTGHKYNIYCPVVSMNKEIQYKESGIKFFNQISQILEEFGVKTKKISIRKIKNNKVQIRLILSSKLEDLLNLYEKINFEYNKEKSFLGNVFAFYLRRKQKVINGRKEAEKIAISLREEGYNINSIFSKINSEWVNRRFIERSIYEGRKTEPRVSFSFEGISRLVKETREKFGNSGFVLDKIIEIRKVPYNGYVYDFTVNHPFHNFTGNNFLVSNCGVRLIRSNLEKKDIEDKLEELINGLFINIPSGVGSTGKLKLNRKEIEKLVVEGARWAVKNGYGYEEDLERIEEYGCIKGADPNVVSERAYERGLEQSGTLGSGNHFLEIQQVVQIYDREIAEKFGLFEGQITIMVHTGSRGFGYQICDDYLSLFGKVHSKYGISLPDRQLACAPAKSPEGRKYFAAMKAAANYAFANRQVITHWVRETFSYVLRKSDKDIGLEIVYDVAHNICKLEKHNVDGREKLLLVHRKGATRAFPKGHPELPERYRDVGQPVIIPGTMGTASYVLVGTEKALQETWGSTCHGAGRMMSRHQAIKESRGRSIADELLKKGVLAKAKSKRGLAEEMPEAYKDVDEVIKVVEGAGISKKVAKMIPLAVIKG